MTENLREAILTLLYSIRGRMGERDIFVAVRRAVTGIIIRDPALTLRAICELQGLLKDFQFGRDAIGKLSELITSPDPESNEDEIARILQQLMEGNMPKLS